MEVWQTDDGANYRRTGDGLELSETELREHLEKLESGGAEDVRGVRSIVVRVVSTGVPLEEILPLPPGMQ